MVVIAYKNSFQVLEKEIYGVRCLTGHE